MQEVIKAKNEAMKICKTSRRQEYIDADRPKRRQRQP